MLIRRRLWILLRENRMKWSKKAASLTCCQLPSFALSLWLFEKMTFSIWVTQISSFHRNGPRIVFLYHRHQYEMLSSQSFTFLFFNLYGFRSTRASSTERLNPPTGSAGLRNTWSLWWSPSVLQPDGILHFLWRWTGSALPALREYSRPPSIYSWVIRSRAARIVHVWSPSLHFSNWSPSNINISVSAE